MPSLPKVAVIGGGSAGLSAASNLAMRGVQVALIERERELGGNALSVCCKAIAGECQLCGGCLLADHLAEVKESGAISLHLETAVTRVEQDNGSLLLHLSTAGAPAELDVDAVVLATGFDHVDAHTKGPYGYGTLPGVITGEELEKRLKAEGQGAYDDLDLHKVAFIQCVGSRDEHVGRGYCSQVCCRYGLRLARLLKSRNPEAEVTVFKMDIQTSGRDFGATWSAVSEEGVRLVSGLPAVIRRSVDDPCRATFVYDDILEGKIAQQDFDLVVLSVGIQPRSDAAQTADLFGVNQDEYGFLAARDDESSTIAKGVYLAGCCQAPRSISESMAHARQAAEACYTYLQEK